VGSGSQPFAGDNRLLATNTWQAYNFCALNFAASSGEAKVARLLENVWVRLSRP
jgi:hypothetical protein